VSGVVLVDTGVANRASIVAALRRAGADVEPTLDATRVREAARVVLPGNGAFGAAMAALRSRGVDDALRDRVARGRPLLAICLGLQLLAESSEESPGVAGLGVVAGAVVRLRDGGRVPRLGWGAVAVARGAAPRWLRDGDAWFAHSFALREAPRGAAVATSDHGGALVAAFERGPLLACQFHPELSGEWGGALIQRWLAEGAT